MPWRHLCWCCHQKDCPDFKLFSKEGPASIECHECNRHFFGVTCQVNHMIRTSSGIDAIHTEQNSVCQTYRKRSICGITFNLKKIKEHRCREQECPSCHHICNLKQHQCYIQPVKKKQDDFLDDDEEDTVFSYFDIEARQDTGNHQANLLCAETHRNDQQYAFWGDTCVSDFLQWCYLLAHQADVNQLVVVAHNFKRYDGYMVMEALYKEHVTELHHIVNGAKILTLSIPNIKFINSLNFLPMALADFPETFGLTELTKGFFPIFSISGKMKCMWAIYPIENITTRTACHPHVRNNLTDSMLTKSDNGPFFISMKTPSSIVNPMCAYSNKDVWNFKTTSNKCRGLIPCSNALQLHKLAT